MNAEPETSNGVSAKSLEDELKRTWRSAVDAVAWPSGRMQDYSRAELEIYAKGVEHALGLMAERFCDLPDRNPHFRLDWNDFIGAFGERERRRGEQKPTRWPSINEALNQIRDWRIALTKDNKHTTWQALRPIERELWRWCETRAVENEEKLAAYQLAYHEAKALNDLMLSN